MTAYARPSRLMGGMFSNCHARHNIHAAMSSHTMINARRMKGSV